MQKMQTTQNMHVDYAGYAVYAKNAKFANQTYQAKLTKPTLPNQIKPHQAYWTKPTKRKLLVKAVYAWVRSAFGNVFSKSLVFNHSLGSFSNSDLAGISRPFIVAKAC